MERKWVWRLAIVVFLVILATGATFAPNAWKPTDPQAADPLPEAIRDMFPGINLGLDKFHNLFRRPPDIKGRFHDV